MKLIFGERRFRTSDCLFRFDEACWIVADEHTFKDLMSALDILDDEVDFSNNYSEDGLPESKSALVSGYLNTWVHHYNRKLLEPYDDKETNILLNDLEEEGIQLLYLYQYDPAANAEEQEKEYSVLEQLFHYMTAGSPAYIASQKALDAYENSAPQQGYLLLKITITDSAVEDQQGNFWEQY